MKSITRKQTLLDELAMCLQAYEREGMDEFIRELHARILQAKVKFPLLETAARELFRYFPEATHPELCDKIERLKTIGGNVLIGILLQQGLVSSKNAALAKTAEIISKADDWYVADIIGERVWGWGMRHHFQEIFPFVQHLANHLSHWVVRSIGAGSHYAIKKGLPEADTEQVFHLLLSLADRSEHHIKTGIGWAAKTTAKFHPAIIARYSAQLENTQQVHTWFRTKVRIGLQRHDYAQRNRG